MRHVSGPVTPRPGKNAYLLPVLAAAAAAVICGLPHLVMIAADGARYTPFSVLGASGVIFDETIAYAPRVEETLGGHPLSGDPHGFEHKANWSRALPALLPSSLLAGLGWLLGRSVPWAFVLADLIFPALAVICAYLIARNFRASRPVAALSGLLVVLSPELTVLPMQLLRSPLAALAGPLLALHDPTPLEFSRTFVPQFSYLLVLMTVLLLQRALLLRTARWTILAGVVAGLLSYTYAYAWPYLLCALAILAAWLLAAGERSAAKHTLGAGGIALAIGALVPVALMLDARAGGASDMVRLGAGWTPVAWRREGHRLAVTALLLLLYPRGRREYPLVAAFLIAPLVCALASDLSGLRLQDWHWIWRYWMPWMALCTPVLLEALLSRRWRVPTWAWAALALLAVVYAANRQCRWAIEAAPAHLLEGDRAGGLTWLADNAPRDAVVVGLDFDFIGLVPVYTGCNLYLPFAVVTPSPDREILQRYAHSCATLGLSQQEMLARIEAPRRQTGPMTGPDWICYHWTLHFSRRDYRLTDRDRRILSEAWKDAWRVPSPQHLPFRADYLWVGPDSAARPHLGRGWRQAWREHKAAIYEVADE